MSVPSYRVTSEDLPDLDSKTREGLQPLLDALNMTLNQLVLTANAARSQWPSAGTFTTEDTGSVYVSLVPRITGKPSDVTLKYLRPNDGSDIDAAYSWTWTPINTGIRLLFVGLKPSTKYDFGVSVT